MAGFGVDGDDTAVSDVLEEGDEEEHGEACPHVEIEGKCLAGEALGVERAADGGDVAEDVADEDEGDDLELVGDGAGGGGGQGGDQGEDFVEEDEVERGRDGGEVVGAEFREGSGRMGERREEDEEEMQGEAGDADANDEMLEGELVRVGEDAIVDEDKLLPRA